MTIFFYAVDGAYGGFSNFALYDIALDGLWWPTTEHYFQAQKFAGTHYVEWVRCAPTPRMAAEIGRDRRLPLRPEWEQVKDEIMRRAVLCKFETHSDLRDILLATGEEALVEENRLDPYWGCGQDWNGANKLGTILMEIRAILRERQSKAPLDRHGSHEEGEM